MGSQKPRILPWLFMQIDSKKFPGLSWTNLERTEFSVPWKHGLRQDRSDEDFQIFEAWAIASRTYNPATDQPNPPVWKRNFRSALNRKANISVIKDNSSDSNHPHKVYRILSGNDSSPDSAVAPQLCDRDSPSHLYMEEDLQSNGNNFDLSQELEDLYLAPGEYPPYSANEDATCFELLPQEPSFPMNHSVNVAAYAPGQLPIHNAMVASSSEDTEAGQAENCLPFSTHHMAPQQPNPLEQLFPNQSLETDFEVKVFYRGQEVKNIIVKNGHGFRLVSCPGFGSPEGLEEVVLPEPSSISDQEAKKVIEKLLRNLEAGLLLEVRGADICGRRLGKCHAYWSMTETPSEGEPNRISKEGYTTLYTRQRFISDLIAFINRTKKASPLYSIWLCLGERWPDLQKPWKKKLIMVQVTPVVFKLLHELSYSTGASSLQSSDLQISDSLNSDNLLWCLQDFAERMEH